jgi:hypothetical protein
MHLDVLTCVYYTVSIYCIYAYVGKVEEWHTSETVKSSSYRPPAPSPRCPPYLYRLTATPVGR